MTLSESHSVLLISNLLVIIGALNWLTIGLLKTDYVTQFVGTYNQYVFIIVGLAGLYLVYNKPIWFMGKNVKTVEHMCNLNNGKLVCQ